jgi:hypothetical protein
MHQRVRKVIHHTSKNQNPNLTNDATIILAEMVKVHVAAFYSVIVTGLENFKQDLEKHLAGCNDGRAEIPVPARIDL